MDDRPTFGSLFAGIGGLDLGLERAGWRCAWQVELDEFCQRVLRKHWPYVPKWRDVREFPPPGKPADWWDVDLICGGFPCQPVSVAGKRLGQDDERWMWPEFARVVRVLRPRLVLVENVPGLLARGMGDVLGDLAASGYDAEWDCLPAEAFGAHHLRDRAWIVAYAHSDRAMGDDRDRDDAEWDEATAIQERENVLAGFVRATRRSPEPAVARVADGLPDGLDRWRERFGNAVVPQVAEWIGRRLMAAHRCSGAEPPRP